ncbi:hypothetical protein [Actinomyces israelii]|uniref:hypothetical protein n=1 Tax=Actinomyces israelii TaxID=1659 RepID=UPI000ABC604D|nr:hypothetical protein [Actinomyces israelii]
MSPSADIGRSRAGGGAGGSWRQAPTEKVYSCDRADRDRGIEAWAGSTLGTLDVLFTLNAVFRSVRPYTVILLFCGCALILYGAGRFVLRGQVRESPGRWRLGTDSVEFGPCWGFLLWEQMPPAMVVAGAVVVLRMPVPSGVTHSGTSRVLPLVLAVLCGAAITWATMPVNPPQKPEVILEPLGMWLWPDGRYRAFIPWELEPVVAGRARHGTQVCAVITLDAGPPAYFPIFPIPLGYVQLQRVVEFYSTHPELRDELAAEAGLERVRTLMYTPVWRVEEDLPPAPAVPSQEPAALYEAFTPIDDTNDVDDAAAAVSDAVADTGGAAPTSSPVPRSRPARKNRVLAPTRPQPPSGAIDCEKADGRRNGAPLRSLFYAVIVFVVLVHYAAGDNISVLAFLGSGVILILLLHALLLLGMRISIALASRRWGRCSEGIALPRFWIFPAAKHLGALLLAALGLFSAWSVLFDRDVPEDLPIPSLCAATACIVVAVVTWRRTPRPRLGAEIILDPTGLRVAPGTRHEASFLWTDGPRVVGAVRFGSALVITPDSSTAPVSVRMGTVPLTYVQLQRVVEFYSTHPELRDELAAEAGLERVRTLMSVPVWQIEEEESLPLPSACAHRPAASNKACAPGDDGGSAEVSPAVVMEPPIPPGALDCARADRRRMAAPRRTLVGALGILAALIAVLAAELRTTMIFLLAVTFILMLLRAAALYVFRSPLEHADEQWVLSDSGVALPSLWASPLATRMGAAALLLTGLFSFSVAAAAIPHEERLRVPSMAAAVVCVVVACMVWSGTRRPHGGPEILLDPRGARFAPGTGREVVLPWDGHPRVVGASRGQMLVGLLCDPGAGLVRLPMDSLTAGCTQLRQVMELYSTRPELRRELAAEAGLERVRTLMRAPV